MGKNGFAFKGIFYTTSIIEQIIDYERFNLYSIVHHATSIEGSTLTQLDTELLLSEGITAKGKPLEHHLMVQDHFKALSSVFI